MAVDRLFMDIDWKFEPKLKVFDKPSALGALWAKMTPLQREAVVAYLEHAARMVESAEAEVITDTLAKITHKTWIETF